MEDNLTLMDYQKQDLPEIELARYQLNHDLEDFSLDTILGRYKNILDGASLRAEPKASWLKCVDSDDSLTAHFWLLIDPLVQNALESGFQYLETTSDQTRDQMKGLTVLAFGPGRPEKGLDSYSPDVAFFPIKDNRAGPKRAPGKFILQRKWERASELRSQVLGDLSVYIKQHHMRYGFVLTDGEMVAIRRVDDNGNLELSNPVKWKPDGQPGKPQLTILLALWYFGMLAAHDEGPDRWMMPYTMYTVL